MISPTNYHVPTGIAEGLGQYHSGPAPLESIFPENELPIVHSVLAEITDPSASIVFEIGQVAGRKLLLIDDYSRPMRTLGVNRPK